MKPLKHTLLLLCTVLFLAACQKNQPGEESANNGPTHNIKHVPEVDLQLLAQGLTSPIGVVSVPDESGRLFVIDQAGQVRIIDAMGNLLPMPFLDIRARMVPLRPGYDERGLLGLAFHPDYATNGRFFVYYNAPPRPGGPTPTTTWNNLSKIVEYRVSSNPDMADPMSERVLLQIDDPQSNHNGGTIAFGPEDGMLYIAIGDGGGANDVGPGHVEDWYPVNAGGNGQDIEQNLFGDILRIDVDGAMPYGIPTDNPFVGKPGLDEIWAYGFRNPFRFSFDMESGNTLIAGDAGQLLWEEIDVVTKGGNYGWNVKEGRHCFNAASSLVELPSCPDRDIWGTKLTDPVLEIPNFQNQNFPVDERATTIIGGNVYRGDAIKRLNGMYVFGTFSQNPGTANGELFVAKANGANNWDFTELALASFPAGHLGQYLKGFGQDNNGEVYVTTSSNLGPSGANGKVYKLVPAGGSATQ